MFSEIRCFLIRNSQIMLFVIIFSTFHRDLRNANQAVFENNIFYYPHYGTKESLFNNNIFLNPTALAMNHGTYGSVEGSVFNNNLFVGNFYFPYGSNTGLNNLRNINVNEIFVNYDNSGFNFAHDYHLQAGFQHSGKDYLSNQHGNTSLLFQQGMLQVNCEIKIKKLNNLNSTSKLMLKGGVCG
jgi:hypothetical protein